MTILVTGGAGYIGSHTCVALQKTNQSILVLDNLSNSSRVALRRAAQISGQRIPMVRTDIRNLSKLRRIFKEYDISSVVHFAGLKAVGESARFPLRYYENNVAGTLTLLEAMAEAGCKQLVFSSSATVYGDPVSVPIPETAALYATNPYGESKLMIEHILQDLARSDAEWQIALLRYFNPIGAHPTGLIGEDPLGQPNNLLPWICRVAAGRLPQLNVFGADYDTPDGTGVRDYVHVCDLADGHVKALQHLPEQVGCEAYNLGTGSGHSVLDVVSTFCRVNAVRVPYVVSDRRPGDIGTCYADPDKASRVLGWRARFGLEDMLRDAWRWQLQNPRGYRSRRRPGVFRSEAYPSTPTRPDSPADASRYEPGRDAAAGSTPASGPPAKY